MNSYPVTFSVDYPDRQLNRLSTFFRIFAVIPIALVLSALSGGTFSASGGGDTTSIAVGGAGVLFVPVLLMLVFRQKYPRWWFDWNLNLQRFGNRVGAYLALMDDRYPSTDEEQAVHLDYPYPGSGEQLTVGRYVPLVKWFLAIPHFVVLAFLSIGAALAVVAAWVAVLFTGRYPRGLFDFVEGVLRWHNRVAGYALVLVTDEYPPFRLRP